MRIADRGPRGIRIAGLVLILAAIPAPALAATWLIRPDGSGDFPTIQAGVDAAAAGDVILLANGVFLGPGNRDVDFQGKTLVVRSQSGHADACRIDCDGSAQTPHRAFRYVSGEGFDARLEALTIANGYAAGGWPLNQGGGILIAADAAPSIVDCVFEGNRSEIGGALFCAGASPYLSGCVFRANTARHEGGAMGFADNSFPLIETCTLYANEAIDAGGGITAEWSGVTVAHCTFARNRAWAGSSLSAWLGSTIVLDGAILAFGSLGPPVGCEEATVWISCCDVYGNETGDWIGCIAGDEGVDGNIGADPLFCDLEGEDLRLGEGSPCLPADECERMGAWPEGCGSTPAVVMSWGGLKALFAR